LGDGLMSENLKKTLEEKLEKNIKNFELKSKSSNQLYFFEAENNKLVLKTPNMELWSLSPFWKQLRNIFNSDFISQTENVTLLAEYLLRNPYIKVPQVIYTNIQDSVFQIFEYIKGNAYEPDEFPNEEEISYQLGQYIGWMHSHTFQGYGIFTDNLKLKSSSNFFKEMLASMENIIQEYWSANQEVINFFHNIESIMPAEPGIFSLIMPDISANQFVYSEYLKKINAVVDVDAYVVGPINLELTVLEMCLTDYASFQKGYEQYCTLPNYEAFRSFYRFYMYLNDPYDPIELEEFLNFNKRFSS
jgi:hypothetical protein